MNPDEYAAAQAAIASETLNYVLTFSKFFARPALSIAQWLGFLNLLFPQIQAKREQAATLGRVFYDSQREQNHPDIPRNDRPLEGTTFETFVKNMEPARLQMQQENAQDKAIATVAVRAVREVENAGRQQVIHAVQNDPGLEAAENAGRPTQQTIRGWARVATGRETCAWCLMLVSRGPVYQAASTAGLDINDTSAAKMIAAGTDVSDSMQQWHDGCDCIVVPVFKTQDWPGQAAASRALDLWNDASREASKIQDSDPTVHPSGKNRGKEMTLNQEALNALRRRLYSGDINPAEFAGVSTPLSAAA